ncbi:MAG: nucleotidyltransferase family protein [Methanothrix sp.]
MLLDRLRGNPIDTPQAPRSILPDNIPLEFQVLLSACRVFLGTEEPARLEARLAQGPDWDSLLRLANRHGVMPLLYRSISKNCPQAVPQEWLRRLMLQYMQNAARNMKMTGELLRILDALKEAGIKAVPLKGPVLAQQVYGDVALRQFSDLDIMVVPVDVETALGIIQTRGYKCEHELSLSKRRSLQKTVHHHYLLNRESGIVIELHWTIAPSYYGLKADAALILNRAKQASVMGKDLNIISQEDTLMLLCQHGTKHTWEKLSWICDLAGLVTGESIRLSSAEKREDEADAERVILIGILLVNELLGIEVPVDLRLRARGDRALVDFACQATKLLFLDSNGHKDLRKMQIDRSILYMSLYRSSCKKACYFIGMITNPADIDLGRAGPPDSMLPFYRLVKLLRMTVTYGGAFCSWLRRSRCG